MIAEASLWTPRGWINTGLKSIRGQPGHGLYRLSLELSFAPPEPAGFGSVRFLATGRLGGGLEGQPAAPLGTVFLETPVVFPDTGSGQQMAATATFYADILPAQLDALERARGTGGVQLQLDLQGYLVSDQAFEPFWRQLPYRVPAKEWITFLEDVHYARGFLIQIPEYQARVSPRAAEAISYVEKASQAIVQGNYREAVGLCRDALERAYPGVPTEYKDRRPGFPDSREADKELRFWWLQQALLTVTHAARHADEIAAPIEWERDDAVTAVVVVAALLARDPPS